MSAGKADNSQINHKMAVLVPGVDQLSSKSDGNINFVQFVSTVEDARGWEVGHFITPSVKVKMRAELELRRRPYLNMFN